MPNLITPAFFVRDITIPNTTNAAILERVNAFIVKYEKECLITVLGYDLYKEFIDNPTEPRMLELLNGADYEGPDGKTYRWQGLVYDTDESLIAYYVYYYFQRASATQSLGVSTSTIKTESGVSVSPADKMVDAWNVFSRQSENLYSFLWYKEDVLHERIYPEVDLSQITVSKQLTGRINIFGI